MGKLRNLAKQVKSVVTYYTDKRFSTIAGTLVYFLLMSITPFFLWLTLIFGKVDLSNLLSHEVFAGIAPIINYLNQAAVSAASGAGIVLIATSLWSSTNFFYHLRRSGEIIYNSKRVKSGLKLRLAALFSIFAAIILSASALTVFVVGEYFFDLLLPPYLADFFFVTIASLALFFVAVILNKIACPYKLSFDEALSGSLLTTALWLLFSIGFGIYLRYASPERLYGAIASVIVFLLWCYAMMNCLVIGIINNGSYAFRREYKKLL